MDRQEVADYISTEKKRCGGWFKEKQKDWYRDRVSQIKGGTIVEIGVYGGASLLAIVDICVKNKNKIIGIDPWERVELFNGQKVDDDKRDSKRSTLRQLRTNLARILKIYKYECVELRSEFSPQAAQKFQDNSLSLVFIDGSHSYESVCADLLAWWPKVRSNGGIFSGHDYEVPAFGVKKAVDEFVKERGLNLRVVAGIWEIKK